jgi:hypothetical protein
VFVCDTTTFRERGCGERRGAGMKFIFFADESSSLKRDTGRELLEVRFA